MMKRYSKCFLSCLRYLQAVEEGLQELIKLNICYKCVKSNIMVVLSACIHMEGRVF